MSVTLVLVFGSSIIAGLVPVLLKMIVDGFEPTGGSAFMIIGPGILVAGYALAHWLSKSLAELRGMLNGHVDQRLQRMLSNRLFQHLLSLPLRFHVERRTGALSQTLTNGLIGYRLVLHHLILSVLPIIVELGAMSVVLILLDQAIFLVIIGASVLLYSLAFRAGITRVGKSARAASDARIASVAVLTDSILNYETIKYFGAEKQMASRFGDATGKAEHHWRTLYKEKLRNGLTIAIIFALSLGLSMYIASIKVREGSMTPGELVLLNAYLLQIARPLEMLGFALRDTAEGMAFIGRMLELFDEPKEQETTPNRAPAFITGPPRLNFKHVSYSYDRSRHVLRDINFVVPSGKTVALVGTSGSGKSSLIRLLARLIEPSQGEIRLDGFPLSRISREEIRSAISVVPQDVALFNDSIAYNIALTRNDCSSAEIAWAANIAGIHSFIAGLPDGYETRVGERGMKLSGGEKQRIAIARAAIRKPKLLVFDEATSSLDSETEGTILNNLRCIQKTTTTIIIAHRLSTTVHADQIIVMDAGQIVEQGIHHDLLRMNGAYAAMWNAQTSANTLSIDDVVTLRPC